MYLVTQIVGAITCIFSTRVNKGQCLMMIGPWRALRRIEQAMCAPYAMFAVGHTLLLGVTGRETDKGMCGPVFEYTISSWKKQTKRGENVPL